MLLGLFGDTDVDEWPRSVALHRLVCLKKQDVFSSENHLTRKPPLLVLANAVCGEHRKPSGNHDHSEHDAHRPNENSA